MMENTIEFTISEENRNLKHESIITKEYVHNVIGERRVDIHKGDCGKVLVIAGSKGMAGAAVLAATGAYRAGAGLVRVSIDEDLFTIVQIGVKEATCVPRTASLGDLSQYDVIAVGPGLGDDAQNVRIIKHILDTFDGTVVIDADGLNTISKAVREEAGKEADFFKSIRTTKATIIMTPHVGEARRLLDWTHDDFERFGREKAAQQIAKKYGAVAVMKGHETIVATADGKTYINTTGNAGMATGGSGDVLTGIIAGLAGQELTAEDAAISGVFVHGLAGDMGAEALSEYSLMAGDIAAFTSLAMKNVTSE
ncbi:MAG: NAD(P)H-hydrate dehydratase [Firmicutes bacterium]|nr:NAD(P)H-hydrate dehydratase [Bacillota bacterium]